MMKIAFRLSSALVALFCAGHTAGTLAGKSPGGPADAVLATMRDVHFDFNGSDRTFYAIFFGHSLIVSLYLAGSALLAWWLSGVKREQWRLVAPVAWGLAVAHVVTVAVVGSCFFLGPALLSGAASMLLIVGAIRGPRASPID